MQRSNTQPGQIADFMRHNIGRLIARCGRVCFCVEDVLFGQNCAARGRAHRRRLAHPLDKPGGPPATIPTMPRFDDEPIIPMDLRNMRAVAMCAAGRHETIVNVDRWPNHMTVPSFGPRRRLRQMSRSVA